MTDSSQHPRSTDSSLAWIDTKLARLQQAGLRRHLTQRQGPQQAKLRLDDQELINFGSNDYLGLASDPRLAHAVTEAVARHGWGSGASPLISGRSTLHAELEAAIAQLEQCEASLLFSTGFAANASVIPTLVGRRDAIFADAKNHASLIDGARLSGAEICEYRHLDLNHLEDLLRRRPQRRRQLIVTDSLFSMDGDIAPLPEIVELAERFGAMLLVDEAHATGVFGSRGSGLVEHFADTTGPRDLKERVSVRIGTLSKALGSCGGFACGSQKLIDWLSNRARGYVYSTAMPAPAAASAICAIAIIHEEPKRRESLRQVAAQFRDELRNQGWNIGDSRSQIIPLLVGSVSELESTAQKIRENGIFLPGIRPPTVPRGEALLRISLCHHHGPHELDSLRRALQSVQPAPPPTG